MTSSVSHVQLEYDLRDRVVGWSMSEQMKAELVCDALKMTLWRRKMPRGVIVHSGRGSQYCSHVYQSVIGDNKLRCSMSAKGCCYDNACAESFFLSLKVDYPRGTVQRARGDEFGGI